MDKGVSGNGHCSTSGPSMSLFKDFDRTKKDTVWVGKLMMPVPKRRYFPNSRRAFKGDTATWVMDSEIGTSHATGTLG